YFFPAAHSSVQIEQAGDVILVAQQSLADKQKVVVALTGAIGQKQFATDLIHAARTLRCVFYHCLAKALGKIRMAARPIQNARDQWLHLFRNTAQALCQWRSFLWSEICKLNAASDVERGGAGIANQIGRRGDAQKAESQASKLRILRAAVVELANSCKELIRRKWKATYGIDLIDKDEDLRRPRSKNYLANRPG